MIAHTKSEVVSFNKVVTLTDAQYAQLVSEGQIVIGDKVILYDNSYVYLTPDPIATDEQSGWMSAEDKSKLDAIEPSEVPVNDVKVNNVSVVTGGVANVTVPTKTSDLTNDLEFIDKDVNNLTNYTKTSSLASVATSGDYTDLSNTPDLSIYAETADLKDCAYLDEDELSIAYSQITGTPDLSDMATQTWVGQQGYLTGVSWNDVSGKPTFATVATTGDYNDLLNKPTLFSGSYNDLTNKPDLSIYAQSANLATVATSGSYNDLTDKPTIPAAQVNSDWDAVSGVAQILNKPSLAAVATSGSYTDLSNTPTISLTTTTGSEAITVNSDSLNVVTRDTTQNITGQKTFTSKVTIQNGSATGCMTFGADVNASTVTANTRKLARLSVPTYETNGSKVVGFVSVDNNPLNVSQTTPGNGNGVEFGSRTGDTKTVGPDYISFSVAKAHNNTDKNNIAQFLPTKIQLFNHESGSTDITANPRYNGLIGMWELNNNNTFVNNGYTYTLPNKTGTVALTSDIPTTPDFTATSLNLSTGAITLSQDDLEDIYTNKYDLININYELLPGLEMTFLYKRTGNSDVSSPPMVRYDYTSTETDQNTNEVRIFQLGFWVYYNSGSTPEYTTQGIAAKLGNDWSDITNKPSFATVATSGSYTDLTNTPTIITDVQTTDGTSVVTSGVATIPSVYSHNIYLHGGGDDKNNIYFTLITNFATAFDFASLFAYIYNLNSVSTDPCIPASGTVIYSVVGTTENCRGVAAIKPGTDNSNITVVYHGTGDAGITSRTVTNGSGNQDVSTIVDTVIKAF